MSATEAADATERPYPTAKLKLIPSLFNFVLAAREGQRSTGRTLPVWSKSAEAIESAVHVGSGASFSVSRQRVYLVHIDSAYKDITEPVIRLNSDQAAKLVAVPELKDRPQSVAYKTVNVTFQPTGEPRPRDRVALLNALQEVLVLTHRPIALHPYIINFLGLAWSKVQGTSQQVPVLITEYAEHGTLANVLSRERLHGKAKRRLCLDIALGIQCLHQCGIVHGDVKLENILVTTSENRAFVAKLADFGFATLGDEWPSFLAGTWLWAAPEVALGKVSVPKLTDVFSYGLLVWSIAIDGQSPFGLLQERSSHRSLSRATIKALKQTDDLLGLAKQPMWRNEAKWRQYQQLGNKYGPEVAAEILRLIQAPQDWRLPLSQFEQFPGTLPVEVKECFLETVFPENHSFYFEDLNRIFEVTLRPDPAFRSLEKAIRVLDAHHEQESLAHECRFSLLSSNRSYESCLQNHYSISWEAITQLDFPVRRFLAISLRNLTFPAHGEINLTTGITLAIILINGVGLQRDDEQALRLVLFLAQHQEHSCQAIAYRLHEALDRNPPPQYPWSDWLFKCAFMGSFAALEDLQSLDSQETKKAVEILRYRKCGVGADFFQNANLVNGWSHHTLSDLALLEEVIKSSCEVQQTTRITDLTVNHRGDGLVHFASSCGSEFLIWMLKQEPELRDSCNCYGETPLVCAMRAGHVELVRHLLQSGADASKATVNGDSPLHWLVSIADQDIKSLLPLLMECGSDIHAVAKAPLTYVTQDVGIDYAYGEQYCTGTALHWAVCKNRPILVKELLDLGMCPGASDIPPAAMEGLYGIMRPLHLAAFLHNSSCLAILIEVCYVRNIGFNYSELLCHTIVSGNLYSMIVRHGARYQAMLRQTIQILTDGAADRKFFPGIDGTGSTCLTKAILAGAEEVTIMFLGFPRWRDEINRESGHYQATPFLLAVLYNMERLVPLLLEQGADTSIKGRRLSLIGPRGWSALHYFVSAEHDETSSIFPLLLSLETRTGKVGNSPEGQGRGPDEFSIETPFALAIDRNLFGMATLLSQTGAADADIDALHTTSCQGALTFSAPTTILGRIIKSNMHNSVSRLEYLLYPPPQTDNLAPLTREPSFIVTPSLGLSALHEVARLNEGVRTQDDQCMALEDVDVGANREILLTLLEKYRDPEQLDLKGGESEATALHMAVEHYNDTAVEELLTAGANWTIADSNDCTPRDVSMGMLMSMEGAGHEGDVRWERLQRMKESFDALPVDYD